MNKERIFTEEFKCRHCMHTTRMEVVADYNDVSEYHDEQPHASLIAALSWDAGTLYHLAKCPACQGVSFRRAHWHSGSMDPSEVRFDTLYPVSDRSDAPRGMPETVSMAYVSATKVRSIDPNAYAVLLGRLLEIVCKDRSAAGDTLAKKLADLSAKHEIPERLVDVAKGLRQLRNVGAHADLGELTAAEVPVLDNLTRAILEYVYTAPVLVADAEECLERFRSRKKPEASAGEDA